MHRPRLYPTIQLYAESNVLDTRQLYIKSSLIQFRKHPQHALHHLHHHETRTRSAPVIPRMNKSFGQRHFTFLASKFYNSLPNDIKILQPLSKFKTAVHRWVSDLGIEASEQLLNILR